LLILLVIAAVVRSASSDAPIESDNAALASYVGLVLTLSLLGHAARPL
jgi:hypothetical protein